MTYHKFIQTFFSITCVSLLFAGLSHTAWAEDKAPATTLNPNPEGSAVILLYHRFGEDKLPSTSIRLEQFDAQLDYLADNHFHVWSLSKLVAALKNHTPIPEKTVVLTVDDAWKSVYTAAYPRMKARDWPMTVFVNTDPVDKGYHSNMTWSQMREMQKHAIEFANHSKSHDFMIQSAKETEADWRQRITQDLAQAQKRLQTELNPNTNQAKLVSYPYGEFSASLAKLLKQLGYTALAQNSGAVGYGANQRALMRFPMNETYGKLDSFQLKVNAKFFPIKDYEPFDPVAKDNPPRLVLHFSSPQKNIQCFNHKGEKLLTHWRTPLTLQVVDQNPLKPPRDRYACTQPTSDGYWRWFSHSWIILEQPHS